MWPSASRSPKATGRSASSTATSTVRPSRFRAATASADGLRSAHAATCSAV
jgi:hypothetical protein